MSTFDNSKPLVLEAGGASRQYWVDLWRYRELLMILAWRDVSVRYKQTVIGIAWAFARPFMTMVVFTVIFGAVAKLPTEGTAPYAIMVFAGLLPWTLFSSVLTDAAGSLVSNSNLISKVYFPRLVIPLSTVAVALIDFVVSLSILAGLMLWYGFAPGWQILLLPVFVVLAVLAAIGPAVWASAMIVKYRDLRFIIPFVTQVGLYVSPVGFSSKVVPEQWQLLYSINPMVGVIDGFRWCILGGDSPLYGPGFLISMLVVIVMLAWGALTFRRAERAFADLIYMSDVIIRADKLGKKFVIGHKNELHAVLGERVTRNIKGFWRKSVDMLKGRAMVDGDVLEEFWALRDVDFEIKRGEVVSIIGHNGAGKTTLLKILSRITEPTEGRVEIKGRVASLLEVGTGFHGELSGRENIFLNGAILGMSRAEVRQRFDEIVEFSGVEKFIDTPVKRYSVGMYARLAFAVAAHLESEILVVDEVLAVGDAEFQARCLDRMSKVADAGRTVLFVSHNLAAVTALTSRAIVFQSGRVYFDGPIDAAVAHYATSLRRVKSEGKWGKGASTALISAAMLDDNGTPTDRYEPGKPMRVRVVLQTNGVRGMTLELVLRDEHNLPISFYSTSVFSQVSLPGKAGRYECSIVLQPYWLAAGEYCFDFMTTYTNVSADHRVDNALRFFVERCSPDSIPFNFTQNAGKGAMAMRLAAPVAFTEIETTGDELQLGPQ